MQSLHGCQQSIEFGVFDSQSEFYSVPIVRMFWMEGLCGPFESWRRVAVCKISGHVVADLRDLASVRKRAQDEEASFCTDKINAQPQHTVSSSHQFPITGLESVYLHLDLGRGPSESQGQTVGWLGDQLLGMVRTGGRAARQSLSHGHDVRPACIIVIIVATVTGKPEVGTVTSRIAVKSPCHGGPCRAP